MNKNQLYDICIKSITGDIEESEKKLLNSWLNESEANRKEFNKLETIWKSTLPNNLPEFPSVDSEWIRLNEKINSAESENSLIETPIEKIFQFIRFSLIPGLKPALSGAVVLAFLISAVILLTRINSVPVMKTITTADSQRENITLPDGSLVNLNNNSTLEYPESFGKENREVKLNGEAFFSVAKDARHPFVIKTSNAKVTVLGTKFDVCSRTELTKVFVKEGKVKLSNNKSDLKSVKLTSGQMGTIVKNEAPVAENAGFNFLPGWINGKLEFDRTKLSAIFNELERFYHIKIITNKVDVNDQTLTGTFISSNADSVLAMICLAEDLKFEKQNNSYIISSE